MTISAVIVMAVCLSALLSLCLGNHFITLTCVLCLSRLDSLVTPGYIYSPPSHRCFWLTVCFWRFVAGLCVGLVLPNLWVPVLLLSCSVLLCCGRFLWSPCVLFSSLVFVLLSLLFCAACLMCISVGWSPPFSPVFISTCSVCVPLLSSVCSVSSPLSLSVFCPSWLHSWALCWVL